jgi:hypothetical protein
MRKLIALFLLVGSAAVADEKDNVEQAKSYFEAGKVAYEATDYMTAIRSFDLALRAIPKPPIKFSLAQAYRKQFYVDRDAAKLKQAVRLYREYLDEVKTGGRRDDAVQYLGELQPQLDRLEAQRPISMQPAMPPPATQLMVMSRAVGAMMTVDGGSLEKVPQTKDVKPGEHKIHVEAPGYDPEDVVGLAVDGRLVVVEAILKEQPARIDLKTDSGADVQLDGRSVPFAAGIATRAGRHFLTVTERGHHPFSKEVTLQHGEVMKLDADLQSTSQRKISGWVLGGAGVLAVGGAVTTVLALIAQGNAQSYLDKQKTMNLTLDDLNDYNTQKSRRDQMVMASGFLYGGAVVLGVTGLLLRFVDNPRVEAGPAGGGTIQPVVTPEEVGMAYTRRF